MYFVIVKKEEEISNAAKNYEEGRKRLEKILKEGTALSKYEGVYDGGWEKIREQRFEKQKELGIWPANNCHNILLHRLFQNPVQIQESHPPDFRPRTLLPASIDEFFCIFQHSFLSCRK